MEKFINQLKEFYAKVPPRLKNKYVVAILFFLTWMLFVDQNNFFSQLRLYNEVNDLKKKRVYYKENIQEVKKIKQELFTDDASIEKFAREKYWMKKEHEEIFIIEKE